LKSIEEPHKPMEVIALHEKARRLSNNKEVRSCNPSLENRVFKDTKERVMALMGHFGSSLINH
ncbi:hypothetical protein, partial [Pseudoalteromonas sp. S4492]|uniref:hypothetical protein n=1 Tax=Pseudoalteromonas sp. S4492 TaxID=579560 RepID=UPI001BB25C84